MENSHILSKLVKHILDSELFCDSSQKALFESYQESHTQQIGEKISTIGFIDGLAFDSLDVVEFIMFAEDTFEIEIPDEEAEKVTTIGDTVELIENLRKSKTTC